MDAEKTETVAVRAEIDVVAARRIVRAWTVELGFSLVDQTKMVTAASELARNTLTHGLGGTMTLTVLNDGSRHGLQLSFEDHGPGIADLAQALKDGYTTGSGMGMGLGGAKRLVNQFQVETAPGRGTRVTVTRWK